MLATCINTESQIINEKRLLLTDPDYADNKQLQRDIQLLKATMICRVSHASTVLMIPGKSHCYSGWKTEYSGNLMSGHHGHAGASQYVCVESSPDVLEAGSRDDNGYLLYGVKAYCGSLKCPPYVQDTLFKCVVCSK
ncbi:uncharacterized protein LOC127721070 [Mytilus californianus]|uniref:uncharacterized protein LOC127721070 n=1 Tax=Mytilus californianus TaxID=6549 RepID=UPI0022460FE5|nr:uncharacterized protein LOC127721070 [Mytilus californianus]